MVGVGGEGDPIEGRGRAVMEQGAGGVTTNSRNASLVPLPVFSSVRAMQTAIWMAVSPSGA